MAAASPILEKAVAAGTPLLFLSAHRDDAVLSCGALIESVKRSSPVTVATLFTAATCPPHTRAARSFLRQCDAADAAALFAERRAEDVEAGPREATSMSVDGTVRSSCPTPQ